MIEMTKTHKEVDYDLLITKVIDSKRNIRNAKKKNIDKLKRLLQRYATEKKKITMQDLADKMNVSKMTISRYLKELTEE